VATPLPGTVLYREMLNDHPELADRSRVRSAGFGLFTALTPTRLDPREFYERLADLYGTANHMRCQSGAAGRMFRGFLAAPWLAAKMIRVPRMLRALKDSQTFIEAHRAVQGDRLMTTEALSPLPAAVAVSAAVPDASSSSASPGR
jgi:hypothetical protein